MPVFSWWELDLISLKISAMISGVSWGVCELGMALGTLSANGQHYIPILLMICCELPGIKACWPLGETWL